MVVIEKSFPRGGIKNNSQNPDKRENDFGALQIFKKKPKKAFKDSDYTIETEIKSSSVELLNYDTIQCEMIILGYVNNISPTGLKVLLPGHMTGHVSALAISDTYSKTIKDSAEISDSNESFKTLNLIYNIGQIVYGKVIEITKNEYGLTNINLSLKPSDVHKQLNHSNICKGFIFNGAIEEIQEHGYIIETGIRGLRSFLPLEKILDEVEHSVGQLVFLKVLTISHDVSVSTCICKEINANQMKVKNQIDPNFDYILPSNIVQFTVTKNLKNGLEGNIMDGTFPAYIHENHIIEKFSTPNDFEIDSTHDARILYVMPLTKFMYLTLNVQESIDEPYYKRGDIIEDATVHRIASTGITLVLQNQCKGIISFKSIKSKLQHDESYVLKNYTKKSKHKIRILNYDYMESMYFCTDEDSIVSEKIFTVDDVTVGDFVVGVISKKRSNPEGYDVLVGKVRGILENIYVASSVKTLETDSKVRCRVLDVSSDRQTIYLTNRPEYMSTDCKLLSSINQAKPNETFTGTIVRCDAKFFLVKFFNNLKGILHKKETFSNKSMQFYEGQTMNFQIASVNNNVINLDLLEESFNLGEILPCTVTHILDNGLEIEINTDVEGSTKGFVPLMLLSDFTDLLHAHIRTFNVGDTIEVCCISKNVYSIRDVEIFKNQITTEWKSVKPGDILKSYVKNVKNNVIDISLPIKDYEKSVKIHTDMLSMNTFTNSYVSLTADQIIFAKILSKETTTKTLTVSAKLIDVWDGKFTTTAKHVEDYLSEVEKVKTALKKQKNSIAKYSIGDEISAVFKSLNSETKEWEMQIVGTQIHAIIKPSFFKNKCVPKSNEVLQCIVVWIDYSKEIIYLTNNPKEFLKRVTFQNVIPSNLIAKTKINAKVLLKLENILICSLKKGKNPLVYCPARLHNNDFESSACKGINEGDFCKLNFIHEHLPIAVFDITFNIWQTVNKKRKLKSTSETIPSKISKIDKETTIHHIYEDKLPFKESQYKLENSIKITKTNKTEKQRKVLGLSTKTEYTNKTEINTTFPAISSFWSTDLPKTSNCDENASDEDLNEDNTADAKRVKLTAAAKFELSRKEESKLRKLEDQQVACDVLPESVEQFDRLVLSDPNNSKYWINYMAFHIQSAEMDKARFVGRKAIKAISFRQTEDLINVWIALLNLEQRYGTKESFKELFKESLTYNDPLKMHLRVLDIISNSNKLEELTDIVTIATKKFKTHPEIWKSCANAYFNIKDFDRGNQLLHKSLLVLPDKEHVNTIVSFANLNQKHGNSEQAHVLLEQVVSSYPKRVDVWSQYVDVLIKDNLIDSARNLLERAIIQKIPMKKMRILFKKYLDFEKRYGNDENVAKVKLLASNYVERSKDA